MIDAERARLLALVEQWDARRDDMMRASDGETWQGEIKAIERCRRELAALIAADGGEEQSALVNQLGEALDEFVEWHGGAHVGNCPEDDTCDCLGAGVNARVNTALQAWEQSPAFARFVPPREDK